MDHLPLSDIPMLVSTINFLLRDEIFDNLDQICYCFNVDREEMDRLLHIHQVKMIWVKGHADNPNNNRCDELAVAAYKSL